ncbi:MAG: thioredoxin family protein [Sphaerospermopsis sp. SIO1G2]|nr:thioredoxin family protein [Sphaerospermopsis sp. SIO1G1]NET71990.1 thioredoxin family protein [Sphaerospermopsis sp. SIO1G2]
MSSINWLFLQTKKISNWQRLLSKFLLLLLCLLVIGGQPAFAGMKDDRFEGNIFVVFAGNGSLVPPRQTLAQTLAQNKPAMLAFYLDDSKDCKQYAVYISQTQAFYGKEVEIIPVSVDTIFPQEKYDPTQPGYYYDGGVPQIVLFDKSGEVILNKKGQVPFEEIDDKFREVFDLAPRDESLEFKQRSFNEYSSEISQ